MLSILSVPLCQKSRIIRSHFYSVASSGGVAAVDFVALDLAGFDLGILTAQPIINKNNISEEISSHHNLAEVIGHTYNDNIFNLFKIK